MNNVDNQHKNLSRIKEILFGEELQGLDAHLTELREELIVIIENQVKTIEEKLKAQETAFEKQIEILRQQLTQEEHRRKELEKALQEVRKQLETFVETKAKQYNDKLKKQTGQQNTQNKAALEALKTELLKSIQKLDETKLNKTEITELFGLMIQKLK